MRKAWIPAVAALAALAIAPAANASTASRLQKLERSVKALQHDNKVLSSRLRSTQAGLATTQLNLSATTGALNALRGCMHYVKMTRYGSSTGAFGYLYSFDPTVAPFATTAIDATIGTSPFTAFLVLAPECVSAPAAAAGRSARAFGPSIPAANIATDTRSAPATR